MGKALKGPICTYEFSGGVANNHSEVIGLVATTIAHEMGHNFGMEHDTEDCECPDDKCIMSPSSTSVMPIHWSKCSLRSLVLAFARGMDYCLRLVSGSKDHNKLFSIKFLFMKCSGDVLLCNSEEVIIATGGCHGPYPPYVLL